MIELSELPSTITVYSEATQPQESDEFGDVTSDTQVKYIGVKCRIARNRKLSEGAQIKESGVIGKTDNIVFLNHSSDSYDEIIISIGDKLIDEIGRRFEVTQVIIRPGGESDHQQVHCYEIISNDYSQPNIPGHVDPNHPRLVTTDDIEDGAVTPVKTSFAEDF